MGREGEKRGQVALAVPKAAISATCWFQGSATTFGVAEMFRRECVQISLAHGMKTWVARRSELHTKERHAMTCTLRAPFWMLLTFVGERTCDSVPHLKAKCLHFGELTVDTDNQHATEMLKRATQVFTTVFF